MLSSISSGLNKSQGLSINEKEFLPILDCYRGRDAESTVPITAGFEISDPKQTGYLFWRKLKIDLVNDVFDKKNMYSVSGRYLAAQTPVSSSIYCKYCVYLAEPLERYLRIVAKRANNYFKGAAPQRMWVAMENYGWMMDLASKNFDYNTLLSFLNRLKLWKRLTVMSNVTGTSPLGGGKGDCYKAFVELYDKGVRVFAKLNTHLLTRSYYSKFEAAKNVVTSAARLAESFTLSSTFLAGKFISQFDKMCHVSTYKVSIDNVERVKAKVMGFQKILKDEDLLYLYAVNNTSEEVDDFDDEVSPYRKLLYLYDGMSKGGKSEVDTHKFIEQTIALFSEGQAIKKESGSIKLMENYVPNQHSKISQVNQNSKSANLLKKFVAEKNEHVVYAIEQLYGQLYPNINNKNWDILHNNKSYVREKATSVKIAISKLDQRRDNTTATRAVSEEIKKSEKALKRQILLDQQGINEIKEGLSRYFSRFYWLKETHEEKIREKFSSLSDLLKPIANNEGGETLEERLKKLLKLYNETDVLVKSALSEIETDLKAYIENYTPNNTTHFKKRCKL